MKTTGIVHRIACSAHVRTDVLDADGDRPVLEVFETVFGTPVSAEDIGISDPNPTPAGAASLTWGEWRAQHPVTVLGAAAFTRGNGATTMSVVAGPDAGYDIAIDPRDSRVSRLPHENCLLIADPCLSRRPMRLDLDAAGGQTQRTIGSTIILPGPLTAPTPPATQDTGSLVRGGETTHIAPDAVDAPRPTRPPQWWAFLIPIGIGVALALLTGMWWFLLFSLSAPLSGYVAYAVEKRRFARDTAVHQVACARALDDAQRRAVQLVDAHRRCARTSSGLCLGFGAVLSRISLAPEVSKRLDHFDEHAVVDAVPIRIDPRTTSVAVTGAYGDLLSMLLAWLSDDTWEWAPAESIRRLAVLVGVVDRYGPEPDRDVRSPARIHVDLRDDGPLSTLRLVAPNPACTVTLVLGGLAQARTTNSTCPTGPVPGRTFTAALTPPGRFLTLVRSRPGQGRAGAYPRHGLRQHYDDAPEHIVARWRGGDSGPVRIGRGPTGDVGVDLFRDGPHALVAGTTGSGKSMLLQTWLLAMALAHPPDRLSFVLIDFKGGATFTPLLPLPHTDSVLDDFDSAAAFRALVAVRAEITRRERVLAHHRCADVLDLADPPPRLVVVIDEFHALMTTHPQAAELLEHLTALGRSLGVHLILATQRRLGVVTGAMKANINIRVCLRVRDEADAYDVLGTGDAAHLPLESPGAACLDAGSSIIGFRVAAPFTDEPSDTRVHRLRLRPWDPDLHLCGEDGLAGVRVDSIVSAAASWGPGQGTAIVPPPLPTVDDFAARVLSLHERASGTGISARITGIIDVPSRQQQFAWSYDPSVDESTVLVGDVDAQVTSVHTRMTADAAATHRIVALGRIAESIDWAEIACGMDAGWRLPVILDHLGRARSTPSAEAPGPAAPTLVVCGNWNELVDSLDHHHAAELDQLLAHARGLGLTFLLAGVRTAVSSAARFRTQVIFPPGAGGDGLSVGLTRQRFAGTWPKLRAVIVGPRTADAGPDGADIQFAPPAEAGTLHAPLFSPRWHGLTGVPEIADRDLSRGSIPLGVDAFGAVVGWDPARDGAVLTVRGSPRSGRTALSRVLASCQAPASLTVHDDAHLLTDSAAAAVLEDGVHVVTMPLRFSPGYGSPLATTSSRGPLLILGRHSSQDLAALGVLRLPPLDGEPGTGWFVTESGAQAVRVCAAPSEERRPAPQPSVSAGGPVRVS